MPKRATLADVANLAGMSTAAASMVLNNRPGSRLSAESARRIREAAPDILGISLRNLDPLGNRTTSLMVPFAITLDFIRRAAPDTPLLAGGTGFSLFPERIMADYPQITCGIAGEAENNILPLLHEAADEGKLAGENAAGYPQLKTIRRRAPLAVVFSDPQIAIVGQRYAELDAGQIVTGEVSFEDQGRSRVMLKNRGLMHVYADRKTGRFLGAEWIGPRAENIAHTLAWAYQMNLTIDDMLAMPFYHPVVEEGVRTALRDAAAKLAA